MPSGAAQVGGMGMAVVNMVLSCIGGESRRGGARACLHFFGILSGTVDSEIQHHVHDTNMVRGGGHQSNAWAPNGSEAGALNLFSSAEAMAPSLVNYYSCACVVRGGERGEGQGTYAEKRYKI